MTPTSTITSLLLTQSPQNITDDDGSHSSACSLFGILTLPDAPEVYGALDSFQKYYVQIHPYLCVLICTLGSIGNLLTIVVLTRPQMLSAINVLLSAVAACDILVMLSNLTFVWHFMIAAELRCSAQDYSRAWAVFMWLHANGSVVAHSTSLWLTVILATVRVISVRKSTRNMSAECLSIPSAIILSCVTLCIVCLGNMPSMLTFVIAEMEAFVLERCLLDNQEFLEHFRETKHTNLSAVIDQDELGAAAAEYFGSAYMVITNHDDCELKQLAFWTTGIMFKMVPCLLLSLFIGLMVRLLKAVSARRRRMGVCSALNTKSGAKSNQQTDKTTNMLIAVVGVFLVTELPQGWAQVFGFLVSHLSIISLLNICTGLFTKDFHEKIYQNLGDIMDLLSLINSGVNFIIYCVMSQKFRDVFKESSIHSGGTFFLNQVLLPPRLAMALVQAGQNSTMLFTGKYRFKPERARPADPMVYESCKTNAPRQCARTQTTTAVKDTTPPAQVHAHIANNNNIINHRQAQSVVINNGTNMNKPTTSITQFTTDEFNYKLEADDSWL